jgi:hypothetical protein
MTEETTTALLIQLNADERAALQRFRDKHPRDYSEAQAARLLLRDALIGIGDLPLPRENRGKGNLRP